jgi:hypothetical protein
MRAPLVWPGDLTIVGWEPGRAHMMDEERGSPRFSCFLEKIDWDRLGALVRWHETAPYLVARGCVLWVGGGSRTMVRHMLHLLDVFQ